MPEGNARPSSPGSRRDAISAIVLAAGEGTRMRSTTPKVLHRLAGRSLIEHAVRAASGVAGELVVVVGHGREAVEEHISDMSGAIDREVRASVQDHQLGTGHAVACGLTEVSDAATVIVSYGDVPLLDTATLQALLAEHHANDHAATVLSAVVDEPSGYGRIVRDGEGAVAG